MRSLWAKAKAIRWDTWVLICLFLLAVPGCLFATDRSWAFYNGLPFAFKCLVWIVMGIAFIGLVIALRYKEDGRSEVMGD